MGDETESRLVAVCDKIREQQLEMMQAQTKCADKLEALSSSMAERLDALDDRVLGCEKLAARTQHRRWKLQGVAWFLGAVAAVAGTALALLEIRNLIGG